MHACHDVDCLSCACECAALLSALVAVNAEPLTIKGVETRTKHHEPRLSGEVGAIQCSGSGACFRCDLSLNTDGDHIIHTIRLLSMKRTCLAMEHAPDGGPIRTSYWLAPDQVWPMPVCVFPSAVHLLPVRSGKGAGRDCPFPLQPAWTYYISSAAPVLLPSATCPHWPTISIAQ